MLRLNSALSLTYVYLLWSMIFLLIAPQWPNDGAGVPIGWRDVTRILTGGSLAWYLWATVVSFLFACLTQRASALAVLFLSLALGFALETYGDLVDGRLDALGRLLPFYILGIRCPDLIIAIANRRKSKAIMVILFTYILLQQQFSTLWDDYARDLLGLTIGLMTAAWAANRYPRFSDRVGWLGRRTLPVYVMHFPIIALLGGASVRFLGPLDTGHPLAVAFTPLLAAASVALSLALHASLMRMGGGWLFAIPRWRKVTVSPAPLPAETAA